jgi:hypothetical protein
LWITIANSAKCVPPCGPKANAKPQPEPLDCEAHFSHAIAVFGESPEGTAAVDPAYVKYAPPLRSVAPPATPQWSLTKETPPALLTENPAVEFPRNVKTGGGGGT